MPDLFSKPSLAPPKPAGPLRYVAVAIERGIDRAGRKSGGPVGGEDQGAFTYSTTDAAVGMGDRVRVPLGRGDKPADGIVVSVGGAELLGDLKPSRVKPIVNRIGAAVSPALLELARWMATYYVCPLGMVLGAMVPAAVKKQTGLKQVAFLRPAKTGGDAGVIEKPKLGKSIATAWALVERLPAERWPLTTAEIVQACSEGVDEGARAPVSTGAVKRMIEAGLLAVDVRSQVKAASATAALLEEPNQNIEESTGSAVSGRPRLTEAQGRAVDGVVASLGGFCVHLLRGVTGSGKTEVYLRAIEEVISRNQTAVVLVPEIALTPQTARRFLVRFGAGRVAVLHSALSASQRHAQWAACAAGAISVVVGARSAVFSPLANLGLIVVDEEHDSSYKQDQLPRYHARDVAIKRAQLAGCPALLGSATPSLESWANTKPASAVRGPHPASEPGKAAGLRLTPEHGPVAGGAAKYTLHTLPTRATGSAMPKVEIVDLALERKKRAMEGGWRDMHINLLGPTLERALGETLAAGEQAMLLLNRRGYANYISCPDQRCGWVKHCDQCDATMVYHLLRLPGRAVRKDSGFVRCHHCLAENVLPRMCPQCGKNTNTFGLGTQRVEEELQRKFAQSHGLRSEPGAGGEPVTMLRLDSDTMTTARSYFDALDRFARGEVRLLLGTQMIAKGLDFPGVTLVGVVNADTSLNMPDFRATERTFQLVSQVAGRAGRGSKPGRVIVQTMEPGAPCIRLAATHDYTAFADAELALRARSGLPPVGRMARVVCRDEDHLKAESAADAVARAMNAAVGTMGTRAGRTLVRGPMPCAISRIANHYRFSVELLAQTRGVVQAVLADLRARGVIQSDAHTAIDVDPVSLL